MTKDTNLNAPPAGRAPTVIISDERCEFCGAEHHEGVCPMVQAVEYYPSGARKRVEFKPTSDNLVKQWPHHTADMKTR